MDLSLRMALRAITFFFSLALIYSPFVRAADTAIAYFNLSGTVPTVFSITTRGLPGDLDLTPNVTVDRRRIGLMHLKYNRNIASLTISSDTASGGPESTSGAVYNFAGSGFQVSIAAGCLSVAPAYNSPFTLPVAGVDVKSPLAANLVTTGIEEDCEILASWQGTTATLPLAGVYKMAVTITMISQ